MAKEELIEIVGKENVLDDEVTLQAYAGDESFSSPGLPWYVIKATSTQTVQDVVHLAKEKRMPLIPISSPSGPRFRGDTIASQGGAILDLSGLNKILNINRQDRMAVIEPGVTFEQLDSALHKEGLRAFKPLMPRKGKSALASYLEREPVLVPRDHWDAIDPLVTTEVVFGTGDLFRTGSAASPPAELDKQIEAGLSQCFAAGPGSTSLSRVIQGAQGTMGVVTWGSVYCGILPQMSKMFFIASENLEPLIDLSYRLSRQRLGEEHFLVNAFQLATMVAESKDVEAQSRRLPAWMLAVNLTASGILPEEEMDYQEKDLRELAQTYGLKAATTAGGVSGKSLMRQLNTPPETFYKIKYKGAFQDVFFTTTLDKTPEHIAVMEQLAKNRYPSTQMGIYLQPMVQGSSCHCEFNLFYDPADNAQMADIKALYVEASNGLAHGGAFFSRPYGLWADLAYSMNGGATQLLRKVKKMLDPEGILNPGKLCF